MARANPELIRALRETAARLEAGARYEWGHMGRCNCGHLVQTLTGMSAVEIVESADHALDEWSEHARDYCTGTGHRVEALFEALTQAGFQPRDVMHLEHLSDAEVLERLGGSRRELRRNEVGDVALYMRTLADKLAGE